MPGGVEQGRVARVVAQAELGAVLDQHAHHVAVAALGGQRQRRHAAVGCGVGVGAELEQQRRHVGQPLLREQAQQRRVGAHLADVVGAGAGQQQQPRHLSLENQTSRSPPEHPPRAGAGESVGPYLDVGAEDVAQRAQRLGDVVGAERDPGGLQVARRQSHHLCVGCRLVEVGLSFPETDKARSVYGLRVEFERHGRDLEDVVAELESLFGVERRFEARQAQGDGGVAGAGVAEKLGRLVLLAARQPLAERRVEEHEGVVGALHQQAVQQLHALHKVLPRQRTAGAPAIVVRQLPFRFVLSSQRRKPAGRARNENGALSSPTPSSDCFEYYYATRLEGSTRPHCGTHRFQGVAFTTPCNAIGRYLRALTEWYISSMVIGLRLARHTHRIG